ncbi:ROK family protein [Rhodococcoides corynebacterioides]|uniref:ROK family protein n=1 Tax=Rhodococcoides corynebacterioides TaxID=53972 RepID=A0ABS7P5W9_9NOCA|nr:ROK family protein [Rhodococcus corynebacterioides]MBY6367778.1 ROK family protein [Rhodococcus corynebacterioides]MBY6407233.1 ROK family protein [Rhodococcus corynebacterioides]
MTAPRTRPTSAAGPARTGRALALDIGGTKFSAALVDDDGRPGEPVVVPTPTENVWAACEELLLTVVADADVEPDDVIAVGIAAAGPVDTVAGSVSPINIAEWYEGFGVVDAVRALFPSAAVDLALDGACAALAEHRFGAARGYDDVLGMVVSTGIGGGVILGGRPVGGRSGNAGHVGHIVVPGSVDPCTCGGIGCVETVASGPNAVRWARENGWEGETGQDLAEAARAGEPLAVAALQRAGVALGQAISSAAALLDLDVAVVGGGFSAAGDALWNPLRETVALHARLGFLADFTVVPAELGGIGTLTGAAILARGA